MQRVQLEHVIRAASGITGATELVIVGSQALLGQFPFPPVELCASIEVDVFTFRNAADAELIDGSIGEGSPFHQTFGYYAHGVAEDTAVLPAGWKTRLVSVRNENPGVGTGLCLEVHDLAVSKWVAGREKDFAFVVGLIRNRLALTEMIRERIEVTAIDEPRRILCLERLKRLASQNPTMTDYSRDDSRGQVGSMN